MPRKAHKYCPECGTPLDRSRFYSVRTIAGRLDASEKYVWKLIYTGGIAYSKIGPKMVRISEKDLREFLDRNISRYPSIDEQMEKWK